MMAFGLVGWTLPPALAVSTCDRGVGFYKSGQYQYALVNLSQACGENPRDVTAHYYLANTLVQQGMHDQAIAEYATCYRLDPRSPVAQFCLQALEKYRTSKKHRTPSALPEARATGSGITEVGKFTPAHTLIRRQAQIEKTKHQGIGDSMARNMANQADFEARRLRREAEEEIERVLAPPVYFPIGRPPVNALGYTPEEARAKADEIRRNVEDSAQAAKLIAAGRAQQYRNWSNERQHALDEVVENLEKQLSAPPSSGVKLQPVGTDLYVRFYGYKRSTPEMPDVRPADVRLIDQDTVQFEALRGEQHRFEDRSVKADPRVVRGKLIDKQLR
jgi:hypothetical protein